MWFADSRGKPAKWMRMYRDRVATGVGMALCQAAIEKLDKSPEHFVMVREPHVEYLPHKGTYIISARVRWVPDQETAERRISFQEQFENEIVAWEGEDPANRHAERF